MNRHGAVALRPGEITPIQIIKQRLYSKPRFDPEIELWPSAETRNPIPTLHPDPRSPPSPPHGKPMDPSRPNGPCILNLPSAAWHASVGSGKTTSPLLRSSHARAKPPGMVQIGPTKADKTVWPHARGKTAIPANPNGNRGAKSPVRSWNLVDPGHRTHLGH